MLAMLIVALVLVGFSVFVFIMVGWGIANKKPGKEIIGISLSGLFLLGVGSCIIFSTGEKYATGTPNDIYNVVSPGDMINITGEQVQHDDRFFAFVTINSGKDLIAVKSDDKLPKEGKVLNITDRTGSRNVICPIYENYSGEEGGYVTIPYPKTPKEEAAEMKEQEERVKANK